MDIQDVNPQQFVDLFNTGTEQTATAPLNFSAGGQEATVDLFQTPEQVIEKEKEVTVEGEEKETKEQEEGKEVDLFSDEGKEKQAGRPPKYNFTDTSGYFEDRFKSGKFVAITEEKEDGSKVPFIPKTPEEFDEVIDIQVNFKVDEIKKELEESWYANKPAAWQAVAKYAEMTDNPADILPFIQGIANIDSVNELNPEDLGHAEKIVRARLQQRGDDEETISETIESLKTTDKLVSTATKYKPAMVNQERQQLAEMVQQKRAEEQQYISLVNNIREGAIKAIEAPIFGKQKLKQEEKAAIYDLIAQPAEETKGYRIYSEIDSLFEKGDFETLRQVALLLKKKDSFMSYISIGAADQTATGLQKKLRLSTETGNGGKDTYNSDVKTVNRAQYNPSAKFGRQ